MENISRVGAVREFLGKDSSRPIDMKEMMAFWSACTEAEKVEFSESAARQLGKAIKV
jgi:hypothetical protein